MAPRQRILFLDAYDSFTNNITSLLTTLLDVDVYILPIDSPLLDSDSPTFKASLRIELSHYEAVICGPGPGSPENKEDVGLMKHIWGLDDGDLLPVLGICLGFQSLVTTFGGTVRRLQQGLHGMVRQVQHEETSSEEHENIFQRVGTFQATLYHSLCVDIGQDCICPGEWETERWVSTPKCPNIIPLGWVEEGRHNGTERILMAAKHTTKPFWGLQYHPESVCTDDEGHRVLKNWFAAAMRWNKDNERKTNDDNFIVARSAMKTSLLSISQPNTKYEGNLSHDRTSFPRRSRTWNPVCDEQLTSTHASRWKWHGTDWEHQVTSLGVSAGVQAPDLVEALASKDAEHIILDSANASIPLTGSAADVRGQYSIIALDVQEALRIEYRVGDDFATAILPRSAPGGTSVSEKISLKGHHSIWQLLAEFHEARKGGHTHAAFADSPFMGGFMGYVTYEQGLSGLGVAVPQPRGHSRPDLCFVWVTKSLVVHHARRIVDIQILSRSRRTSHRLKAKEWVDSVLAKLEASTHLCRHNSSDGPASQGEKRLSASSHWHANVRAPHPQEYEAKVELCQEYIAAGESYELCLTDQTTVALPRHRRDALISSSPPLPKRRRFSCEGTSPWQLYRSLRHRQPAPFASYIRLGGATLISSSPERFLKYERNGLCIMKPMKGTVRKSDKVSTLAEAEAILHVPKEEAENLMIVDLVRHDLHGICGPGNVSVPLLMKVEEFQSVFQMSTVVEGQLPKPTPGDPASKYTGLDVLAASLPPGSMTGAPKKRSCEILQHIEQGQERSLYSGVVGYMCVSGRGDWSVTIRSMFRWDDEQPVRRPEGDADVWNIGAGGAVTILSTAEGEREEMFTKLAGPLGVFADT